MIRAWKQRRMAPGFLPATGDDRVGVAARGWAPGGARQVADQLPHATTARSGAVHPLTATVLRAPRSEDFAPLVATHTRVRRDDRRDDTKHMIRLCHASQVNGREANEIILLNFHDGTSSWGDDNRPSSRTAMPKG